MKVFKAFKVGIKAFKVWREVEKAEGLVKDTQEALNVAEDVLAAKREASSASAMNDAKAAADEAAKEAPSPAPTCHSFLAETPVSLASGDTKAISDLKPGDTVQATDPQTGVTRPEKILKVIVTHTDEEFTDLTLTTDAQPNAPPAHLTTIWHHPFWDATHHRWTEAHALTPGTHLRQPDGTTVTVATVRNYHRQAVTYDLTVADLHSHNVLAGTTPILVHNCGTEPTNFQRKILRKKATPNGTIADLRGVATDDVYGTAESAGKLSSARARGRNGAAKLLNAVFRPKDGTYMSLKESSFSMNEGNHRVYVLLDMARSGEIPWDTEIYVRGLDKWRAIRGG